MEGNSEHTSGNSFRSLDYFCYPDYVIKGLTDGLIERLTQELADWLSYWLINKRPFCDIAK